MCFHIQDNQYSKNSLTAKVSYIEYILIGVSSYIFL